MKLLEAALEAQSAYPHRIVLARVDGSASFQEIFLLKIHVSMSG